MNLTPKEIVAELDKYIVGQHDAKKAVAIALRNRYRRSRLDKELRDEITPKNIIMVGPTGVGKTEIARRLSKLMKAPFVKVEATKFTEVGYVGRDVESMIRDLVEAAIRMVKADKMEKVEQQARDIADERLADILAGTNRKSGSVQQNPFAALFGQGQLASAEKETPEQKQEKMSMREQILYQLRAGVLDDTIVEIEVAANNDIGIEIAGIGADMNLGEMFSGILPKKTKQRKVKVREARKILQQEEADKLIDMDEVTQEAIEKAEQDGIIFLDEIDKIAGKTMGSGPDISREGVQRDILPIVEGSTVVTKYGPVKTDFILFIAAGAFHVSKISDLIPELQGRFPIKVELKSLTKEDFKEILTAPQNAITKQYIELLKTDDVHLKFTDSALEKIAGYAQLVNETDENIGARRLHTILENLLEDISFNAGNLDTIVEITIDDEYVDTHLKETVKNSNLDRFIL